MKRGRNQRRRQGSNPNRALDSNGPDVRIRGTANQIYDKYVALARDASSAGDRIKAESYLQHAEHYFRVIRSMQPSQPTQQQSNDAPSEAANTETPAPASEASSEASDENSATVESEPPTNEAAESVATNGSAENADDKAGASGEEKPKRRRPRRTKKADSAPKADATPSDEGAVAAE